MLRPEPMIPVRMRRVAIVAPCAALRDVLVRVAEAGRVEIDRADGGGAHAPRTAPGSATRRLRAARTEPGGAVLSAAPPDLDALERAGRTDLLAGEAQLEERLGGAVRHGAVAALAGWCPAADVPATAERLAAAGGSLVPLRTPRGVDPPTLLRGTGAVRRSFAGLVRTYGTVPYADLDPSVPAGVVYVVMFGVMFGDAGHGALLLLAGLSLRLGRPRRARPLRGLWPFVVGAGVTSTLAGVAYGEFFGPTGVLPALWLNPLHDPLRLMAAAVGLGAVLLAGAYGAGIVNRWREGGPSGALYALSGVAGAMLYLGLAVMGGALWLSRAGVLFAGATIAGAGLVLAGWGLFAVTGGGPGGVVQVGVQLFDGVLRIGSNVVSFARLAAFGLTHAALGAIVWQGTTALARAGQAALVAAAVLFVVGNALAFALEALVAGVQALRLEFYELFSRVFEAQGRPFRPWRLPVLDGGPDGGGAAATAPRRDAPDKEAL
ncbi:V-type ATPase 116kDa subunit family protein [Streptomyces sparsogenes]|uniref:V-type ATPase n=1 Tax=Streptomyces sparsogenes DSM 40356 TaxID=1331668 RepID=A0A1R1SDQ4_9ACTN|nr:V-type ATPase 116kDa subunit family protein [Streptomyces sparsogenes]OMI36377.1 V-type ATPase [Streptomyces sparsogenes DSM 40356]